MTFSLDRNSTNSSAGAFSIGSANTASNGMATAPAVTTSGWQAGVHTISVAFAATTQCDRSHDSTPLTVAAPGSVEGGIGAYKLGAATIGFAFGVVRNPSTGADAGTAAIRVPGKWQLLGNVTTYVATAAGHGAVSGAGALAGWNPATNNWSVVATNVPYTLTFTDNDQPAAADDAGVHVSHQPSASQPPLPNSAPKPLTSGALEANWC